MLSLTEEQCEIEANPNESSERIVTTLYEVIAALNEQVGPEEDDTVTDAVMHLCRSGRLRLLDASQKQTRRCP